MEIIEEVEEEMKEEVIEEETTQIIKEKFDCSNLEKCEECDQESFDKNLCIKCNHEKGYYYLNYFPSQIRNKYIDCIKDSSKPLNFYFNKNNLDHEPCFTTCASCDFGGNYEENNCTSCDEINYIKNPEEENTSNCVIKCRYYYYIEHNIYTCTKEPYCPEEYNYKIKEKSKCINNCKEDKEYKYRYSGECFKECPNNTKDDNNFICKDIETNKCRLTESEVNYINENITFNEIEKLVNKYIEEFNYTNDHVSLYKNGDCTITIYINNKCILDLGLGIPEINFGSCYEKVKNRENIINNELIIVIIDKKIDTKNTRKVIKSGMFSPLNGRHLNSDEICQDDKITIEDSIEDRLLNSGVNFQILKQIVDEGGVDINDLFNMSSPFYNDICFQYNSKKDIALKDRVLEYFPNITLCEEGCDLMGINMTTITAICECFYSESKKEDALKNKVLEESQLGVVEEMISSSNLYVIKCINLILSTDTIKRGYGGFIILGLIIIDIIFTVIYCKKDITSINKYVFGITNKYLNYLLEHKPGIINKKHDMKEKQDIISFESMNKVNAPPKPNERRKTMDYKKPTDRIITRRMLWGRRNQINRNTFKYVINKNINHEIKNSDEINIINNNQNHIITNNKSENVKENRIPYVYKPNNDGESSHLSGKGFVQEQKSENPNTNSNFFLNTSNTDFEFNIEEYLQTPFDKMEYDEAVRKDHRKFCECYKEKLKDDQIIINIFCSYEPIRPRSIRIIFLILQIDLYFFINGLFYDEEYISNIYHLEKDTFFTMAERFFDNLIYAALAGIVISYIIEFFFIDEEKIRKIFKYEKDNILVVKYEIGKVLKGIKIRYLFFIIICFIISFVALVHIFCFNIVYYHTMIEWIVFSLIIILSVQLLSFLICLVQTGLRLISFKLKNEKLYKLSL